MHALGSLHAPGAGMPARHSISSRTFMCANCPTRTSREISTGELEEAASLATTAANM